MTSIRFISIDDDEYNNALCRIIVKRTLKEAEIETFISAEEALDSLSRLNNNHVASLLTIVFLDINMPSMNSWEFLESFHSLDEEIKNKVRICILSSSVDLRDKKRAEDHPDVFKYLVKPFTPNMVLELVETLSSPASAAS